MTREECLKIDDVVGELHMALEKLEYLNTIMRENYLEEPTPDNAEIIKLKNQEMFIINSMIQDYITDIVEAKETLEEAV